MLTASGRACSSSLGFQINYPMKISSDKFGKYVAFSDKLK